MSAYSAPLVPPPTQSDVPLIPAITCPTVSVSGDVHVVDELFVVFVVSAFAAVGESLQALSSAPPKTREAQAIRDSIDLYLQVRHRGE